MTIWIDAQLSPAMAAWLRQSFPVAAVALRDIGLRDAEDKDSDFLDLLDKHGPPPQVLWLTCGNTSNTYLKQLLSATLSEAITLLEDGERLIEITAV